MECRLPSHHIDHRPPPHPRHPHQPPHPHQPAAAHQMQQWLYQEVGKITSKVIHYTGNTPHKILLSKPFLIPSHNCSFSHFPEHSKFCPLLRKKTRPRPMRKLLSALKWEKPLEKVEDAKSVKFHFQFHFSKQFASMSFFINSVYICILKINYRMETRKVRNAFGWLH